MIVSSVIHILLVLLFTSLDFGFTGICIATSLMFVSRFCIVYF